MRLAKVREKAHDQGLAVIEADTVGRVRCPDRVCAACDYLDRLIRATDTDRFRALVAEARLEHVIERLTS